MSQKFLANDFKWVEDISEFNEDLKAIMLMKVIKNIFLKSISTF